MNQKPTTVYLAAVTAVGVSLTLERALANETADAIGLLLASALVIVLPLVVQQPASRAATAAQRRRGSDDGL